MVSEGKPVRLTKLEKACLDSILKRELPSFHESQKNSGVMYEFKFDTKGTLPISQLVTDIKKFKENFSSYQNEFELVYQNEFELVNKRRSYKLRIDDTPYQPDSGRHGILFTNTAKLHVNISFKDKDDKNIFAENRKLLENAVKSILEQQLPTLALLIDKPGLDRIHKGSASTDMIAARENTATGGVSKFSKLLNSGSLSIPAFAELILADSGAALESPITFYSLALMTLSALMFQRPLSQGNSSLSIRSSSDNSLFSLVQKLTKRSAKGKESTRIENRIIAGNQDPALAILTTLYPIYNVLKNKQSSIETGLGKDRLIPEKPVDLINHALSEETKLREIYGDQLFEKLLKRTIDHFC